MALMKDTRRNYGSVPSEEPSIKEEYVKPVSIRFEYILYILIACVLGAIGCSSLRFLKPKERFLPSRCTFHIDVIRHGEKAPGADNFPIDPHLNATGWRRAHFLPSIFCDGCKYGRPLRLYAKAAEDPIYSTREVDTLSILSHELDLPLISEGLYLNETNPFADALLRHATDSALQGYHHPMSMSQTLCGPKAFVALICWEHHQIKDLSMALGCNLNTSAKNPPAPICPGEVVHWDNNAFDLVVRFDFSIDFAQASALTSHGIANTLKLESLSVSREGFHHALAAQNTSSLSV
jgi:hypothetical protein